jgi:uncharacterized membrane protein
MAEFFLVAFMLLLVDREVAARERLIICLAFLLGMIISHYGLAWMYIGIFLLALLILRLLPDHGEQTFREPLIGVIFVEIFVIINLTWHLFTTSSTLFKDTGNRFLSIYQKFFTSFFHVQESQPATIMEQGIFAPLHIVSKFLNFFAIFLIGLGVILIFLRVIFRSEGDPVLFDREYRALALANFAIFICGFVVPNLFMFNAFRVYHIVLFFLAPFTVVGIVFLLYATGRITRIRAFLRPRTWMMITSIYFAVLFLFGSGLVYEVTREHPSSISLSQETILGTGDLRDINNFFIGYFPESDIFGVQWISAYGNKTNLVYSDWPHHEMPMISYGMMLNTSFLMNSTRFHPGSLVYLGYMNNRYGIINGPYLFRNFWRRSELDPVLSRMNAVYTNGDTWIYQMP